MSGLIEEELVYTPQEDWCVIYTDVSADAGICVGSMVIVENEPVNTKVFDIEYSTGWISELKAIEYALQYAIENKKRKVQIFCDCDSVVLLLNRNLRPSEMYAAAVITRRIQNLNLEFDELLFKYVHRKKNPAHNFAYEALTKRLGRSNK